jgi:hypothetical protein
LLLLLWFTQPSDKYSSVQLEQFCCDIRVGTDSYAVSMAQKQPSRRLILLDTFSFTDVCICACFSTHLYKSSLNEIEADVNHERVILRYMAHQSATNSANISIFLTIGSHSSACLSAANEAIV